MKRLMIVLALMGCDDKSKAPAPTHDAPPPSAAPASTGAFQPVPAPPLGDITWQKPEAWKEVDHPSKMRKATYAIAKVEGDLEDAEMSVTQVGGGIQANIDRWETQFSENPEARIEKKQVHGLDVAIVEIEGTYTGGMGPMMGGDTKPKRDWALLAAVVGTAPAHFFKMTGPRKTVKAARADFDELVASIAKK